MKIRCRGVGMPNILKSRICLLSEFMSHCFQNKQNYHWP